ncbi:Nuclear transport factor 2 (NTF2) family protein [Quillaja saponaria]|uniref:Nuclear transport factor 2 (NTF2) family protein n=1 Tax=Quillaja saponaria TaxID=32244 RepID=A0AAD7PWP9_QUISA|nr:Nuclear transport factor 2 (NTF2) family protein [Quillaja saponaria]
MVQLHKWSSYFHADGHETMNFLPSTALSSSSSSRFLFLRTTLLSHSLLLHHFRTCLAAEKVPGTPMEKLSKGLDEIDQSGEACSKEARDFRAKKRIADEIIPHILNLYGSCATPHDFEIYAPDASFEDPLMRAQGVKQIKSAFYSLSKVFSESKIVQYRIEENLVTPGKQEILIDNKQHYKFLGKDIDLISLIKLNVVDGKVVRHEDWWDKKPLWNRETVKVPLFGRVIEMTRRCSMLATHALMRFGKDPSV